MRVRHVITPGDHFSPSTGSAIPTVVDGLCRFAPQDQPRATVDVARGTYADHYDSADVCEYQLPAPLPRPIARVSRYLDAVVGRLGVPRPFSRRSLLPIVADQGAWAPSVVFAHNLPQLVRLVDAERHAPVLYAHNDLLRSYSPREAARAFGGVHRIICVSEFLAELTAGQLPADLADRVRAVRNGVDAAAFARKAPVARSGPLNVTFIGRMVPEKGADVLIEAVRRLNRANIHVTLIGSSGFSATDPLPAYEQSVREAAAALGNRVTVHPFMPRPEVIRLLQEADVVTVPSRWPEPFALTALEGMAAGAAVIGAEIGGVPESVRGNGFLVPPDDPDQLASVLEALADDESLLRRTADACRAYAESHDWAWASRQLADAVTE